MARAAPVLPGKEETTTTTNPPQNQERIPPPLWERYLKEISRISLHESNSEYRKAVDDLKKQELDQDDWANKIAEAFDKLVPDDVKVELSRVKKTEVDAIRRRLIPKKKDASKDEELPTHLDMSTLRFTKKDLKMLIDANQAHFKKFTELRENDFRKYEMEKRFLEEQKLRHLKTEEKRKAEQERMEAEKAKHANVKVKQPLSEGAAKDAWEGDEELPKEEFNPKTFFAMNDLDSNGLLDMEEVDRILLKELERAYDTGVPGDDKRERREEMERMKDNIYKEIDKNGDFMIDFSEFKAAYEDKEKSNKNWETIDNEEFFNETEFDKYEKERIHEIREDFAEGKKPRGYDFDDVPQLKDTFLNETHIRYNGEFYLADDTPPEVRKRAVKEFYMQKMFEEEQILAHIKDPLLRRRTEEDLEKARLSVIRIHLPLSPERLEAMWTEEDEMEDSEFTPTKFFHLHDIDQSQGLDKQELRLMLLTELRQTYARENKTFDTAEYKDYLENLKEEVFNKSDTDRNGLIDLQEFLVVVKDTENKRKDKEAWHEMHEATEFTDEEYRQYRDQKILTIRKMIAEGVIPENYSYSDVPLLSGNFINATHVMREGVMHEIHLQGDHRHPQRIKDFKRARMEAKYKFEEHIKHLSPEEQAEKMRAAKEDAIKRRKQRHQDVNLPFSEAQEKEVWEKEDKMDPQDFDLEKYFRLHDVDQNGKWNMEEVVASLMGELDRMFPPDGKDPDLQKKRDTELEGWLNYAFTNGDLNKDNNLDLGELKYLTKLNEEKRERGDEEEAWESMEQQDNIEEYS